MRRSFSLNSFLMKFTPSLSFNLRYQRTQSNHFILHRNVNLWRFRQKRERRNIRIVPTAILSAPLFKWFHSLKKKCLWYVLFLFVLYVGWLSLIYREKNKESPKMKRDSLSTSRLFEQTLFVMFDNQLAKKKEWRILALGSKRTWQALECVRLFWTHCGLYLHHPFDSSSAKKRC
jgi:hypothetical protein